VSPQLFGRKIDPVETIHSRWMTLFGLIVATLAARLAHPGEAYRGAGGLRARDGSGAEYALSLHFRQALGRVLGMT
jgi:hypothetical protein